MKKVDQVLIIDDDEVNNLFSTIVIEHSGISGEVHCCTNGPEALDYLASCLKSGSNTPDLILLDINMPFMTGLEFLEEYASNKYHEKLKCKISMLTSSNLVSDINSASRFNFVIDYLVKPLSEEGLKRILQKLNTNCEA
jgi:CheY-like chemotaxis protein